METNAENRDAIPYLSDPKDVVIIGGGLAGLACATILDHCKIGYTLLEQGQQVGGKVSTERTDGFILDRGFQTIIDSYPYARRLLDLRSLELRQFYKGIYIDTEDGDMGVFSDPFRTRIGFRSIHKYLSLADFISSVEFLTTKASTKNKTTSTLLQLLNSRSPLRNAVLGPFLRAVTLDPDLAVPAEFALSILRSFLSSNACLPSLGMDQIPKQLAGKLSGEVNTGVTVEKVMTGKVRVENGDVLNPKWIVVATDAGSASKLIGDPRLSIPYSSVGYMYIKTQDRPLGHPSVYVPSDKAGPLLSLSVVSDVSAYYAPPDTHLVSVAYHLPNSTPNSALSTLGMTREQLQRTFPRLYEQSEELLVGEIHSALPKIFNNALKLPPDRVVAKGIVLAGDYLENPSINGALASGVKAAQVVASELTNSGSHMLPALK